LAARHRASQFWHLLYLRFVNEVLQSIQRAFSV
jgi:hypothetical protein